MRGHCAQPVGHGAAKRVGAAWRELFVWHLGLGHMSPPQMRRVLITHPKIWAQVKHVFPAWAEQLNCALCHMFRQTHTTRVTRPMPRPDAPGLDFGMDFSLGHTPCHIHKYTYFILLIDLCSRYKWAIGLTSNRAPDFVSAFQSWWKRRRQRQAMGFTPIIYVGDLLPEYHLTKDGNLCRRQSVCVVTARS